MLISTSNALSLFHLNNDVVPEIREMALSLLADYFPHETLSELEITVRDTFYFLVNSPKAQETESGSLLVRFYIQHFLRKAACEQSRDNSTVSTCDDRKQEFNFVQQLYSHLEENFSCFHDDFLKSCYQHPIHGWLLVLAGCFDSFSSFDDRPAIDDELLSFISSSAATLSNIAHFFLRKLFSCSSDLKNQYIASADFKELSHRISQIIFSVKKGTTEDVLLSQDFEVVLSSSWLALKNCFLCLSAFGRFLLRNDLLHLVPAKQCELQLNNICSLFKTVLFMCRHRGVIESCYSAFVSYLTSLFNSVSYSFIPCTLLNSLLVSQQQRGSDTHLIEGGSITRRSAGIPLVVDAILTANVASSYSNNMLSECVATLLASLIYLKELDDKTVCVSADLPQVDALFILKNVFQNNKLGHLLTEQLPSVYIASLDCLNSSLWVVRNAATCLLGILSARMLGQQHIEKKFTNSLTASEFFTRYPQLLAYFQTTFKDEISISDDICNEKELFLKPVIYPIMSLLSKLVYDQIVFKNDIDFTFITVTCEELLICRFLPVRTVAAELLLSLHSFDDILAKICQYFHSLPVTTLTSSAAVRILYIYIYIW